MQHQISDAKAAIAIAQDGLEVARRSAAATENAIIVGERAWVSVDVGLYGPIRIGASEVRMEVEFVLKNHGASPAVNVHVDAAIAVFGGKGHSPADRIDGIIKAGLAIPEDNTSSSTGLVFGETIFPGQKVIQQINMGISREDIDKAVAGFDVGPMEFFLPTIIGCVTYRLPYEPKGKRLTGFYIDVRRRPTSDNPVNTFKIVEGEIPPNHVELQRSFLTGALI